MLMHLAVSPAVTRDKTINFRAILFQNGIHFMNQFHTPICGTDHTLIV